MDRRSRQKDKEKVFRDHRRRHPHMMEVMMETAVILVVTLAIRTTLGTKMEIQR